MTDQWHSSTGQDFYYFSGSDPSPAAACHPTRSAVPAGTVASRIIDLQNQVQSSTSNKPLSPASHRRENSRTGFGQRMATRFGQPASRSSNPNGLALLDTEHSFLGLATQRANHMDEHAFVTGRPKWDRTTGLHAQLKPGGLLGRVQYEATSPWNFVSRSKSYVNLRQEYGHQDMVMGSHVESFMEKLPATGLDKAEPRSCSQSLSGPVGEEGMTSNIKEKISAQMLAESSSCTKPRRQKRAPTSQRISNNDSTRNRRQSVRDLYYYYGMQRPAGLVSSESAARESEEQTSMNHSNCHICSRVNVLGTSICHCGHRLCKKCDVPLVKGIKTNDGSAESSDTANLKTGGFKKDTHEIGRSNHRGATYFHQENIMLKDQFPRIELQSQEIPKISDTEITGEQCTISGAIPIARLEDVNSNSGSSRTSSSRLKVSNSESLLPNPTTATQTEKALATTYSISLVSLAKPVRTCNGESARALHHHLRKRQNQNSSRSRTTSEINALSEVDNCQGTIRQIANETNGPNPATLPRERKRHRYPVETDSGYIASASHLDELDNSQQTVQRPDIRCQGHHQLWHCRGPFEFTHQFGETCLQSGPSRPQKHHDIHQSHCLENKSTLTNSSGTTEDTRHGKGLRQRGRQIFASAPMAIVNITSDQHLGENGSNNSLIESHSLGECQQCSGEYHCHTCKTIHPRADHCIHHGDSSARQVDASMRENRPDFESECPENKTASQLRRSCFPCGNSTGPLLRENAGQEVVTTSIDTSKVGARTSSNINPEAGRHCALELEELLLTGDKLDHMGVDQYSNVRVMMKCPLEECVGAIQQIPPDALQSGSGKKATYVFHNKSQTPDPSPPEVKTPSASPEQPVFSSPRKTNLASRRLSAFFRLQEENIVSLLNKRLQEHQDELKRVNKIYDDQIKTSSQKASLIQETDKEEVGIGLSADQNKLMSSQQVLKEFQDVPDEANGLDKQETKPVTPSQLLPGKMAVELEARSDESKADMENVEVRKPSDAGLRGITIVIHLEGRSDIVIETDLHC